MGISRRGFTAAFPFVSAGCAMRDQTAPNLAEPAISSSYGTMVSSGGIRLLNQDIMDLYRRVPVGAKVVVLPASPATR